MQADRRSRSAGAPNAGRQEEENVEYERPLWQKKRFWIVAGCTALIGYATGSLILYTYQRKQSAAQITETAIASDKGATAYPLVPAATAAAVGSMAPFFAERYFPAFLSFVEDGVKRLVMVEAVIESKDEAWRWVIEWLSEQPDCSDRSTLTVTTNFRPYGHSNNSSTNKDTELLPRPLYSPGQGVHVVNFHGKRIFIQRQIKGAPPNASVLDERLTISVFGFSQRPIRQLIAEARQLALERDKSRTVVYVVDQYGHSWNRNASRPRRPLSSVILPDGLAERLVADAAEFLATERNYSERGIPYRRGYLLYGPPGTGKTSFITALAGHLGYNIYVLNLGSQTLTNEVLIDLLSLTSQRAILLLEDIDSAMSESNKVTFSGLLNAIDGIVAQEGRLLFMTTNHLEKLSPALVRPGRIDIKAFFTLAQRSQIERLTRKFFASDEVVRFMADNIPEQTVSMAALQGYLIRCRSDPQWAMDNLKSFLEEEKKEHPESVTHL